MTGRRVVTKTLTGFSTAHRVWSSGSHCQFIHGYDRTFTFTIEGEPDPTTGFVFDFGNFKQIKANLENQFDHTLCVAADDPHLQTFEDGDGSLWDLRVMTHPGMEGAAKWAYNMANPIVQESTGGKARVVAVEARENNKNSATFLAPEVS